jgi:hypothetical protein
VPPRVAARWHQPHRPEDGEAEVEDEAAEAAGKRIEEEVTEAVPQPGALGRLLKKETPAA